MVLRTHPPSAEPSLALTGSTLPKWALGRLPLLHIESLPCVLPPLPRWNRRRHFVSCPATAAFPVIMAGRLPHRHFRGLLGVHCALQPARPADSLTEPYLGVLQPICCLLDRPKCFRLGRTSPVGICCTRGFKVPLQGVHNNICEQALKKAIRHRRNSLFYKTRHGAHVGDLFMSLIHTCELCGTNPFDYLTELERHADRASVNPQNWMPWNYRETLERTEYAQTSPEESRQNGECCGKAAQGAGETHEMRVD